MAPRVRSDCPAGVDGPGIGVELAVTLGVTTGVVIRTPGRGDEARAAHMCLTLPSPSHCSQEGGQSGVVSDITIWAG